MEIEYSLFIFTNLFLFLNLLNSCLIFRRFNRLEIRMKAIEDSQQNTGTAATQIVEQAIISSYPPITTPSYPQMNYYQQPYSEYQAPSAPPYYPHHGPSV